MRMKDIHEARDLREMSASDVVDLLDELRAIATKRGTELFAQGRAGARQAVGLPDERTLAVTFAAGIVVGAAVGAAIALLMTPMPGPEARRRLGKQVERARERAPGRRDGDGRSIYERTGYEGAATGEAGLVS